MTDSRVDNETLARRAIDAIWNRGELDMADEFFAPDYVNHDGLIPDVVRGPEAIKMAVVMCRLAFPDLRITVDGSTAEGKAVVVRWTLQRGAPAPAARPRHRTILTGTARSLWSDGKVVESWMEWDRTRTFVELKDDGDDLPR